ANVLEGPHRADAILRRLERHRIAVLVALFRNREMGLDSLAVDLNVDDRRPLELDIHPAARETVDFRLQNAEVAADSRRQHRRKMREFVAPDDRGMRMASSDEGRFGRPYRSLKPRALGVTLTDIIVPGSRVESEQYLAVRRVSAHDFVILSR